MDDAPDLRAHPVRGAVGAAAAHDSAHKHVAGAAIYVDDIPEPPDLLHVWCVMSPHAHARIRSIDLADVRSAPGVIDAVSAADIPGKNDIGPMVAGEPILAEGIVEYVGQPVVAIAATSIKAARTAGALARVEYDVQPAVLTVDDALAQGLFVAPPVEFKRGDAAAALARAPNRLSGTFRIGGQDHFYLEGQVALAIPQEDGDLLIHSSTQHPSEVQKMVAKVLGLAANAVTVEVRRMGGGFGGKETQPAMFAAIAALLAQRTRRPVKLRLDRDDDMMITGKRHDFVVRWQAGFDGEGRITALDMDLAARAGHVADLSPAIVDRALFHADNCYYIPDVRLRGFACKTHTQSNTAFRGFGGPQGMIAIEEVVDAIARRLGRDPLAVRRVNFYGTTDRNVTPYHMVVEDNIVHGLVDELERWADYQERRRAIDAFNRTSPILKKGLALTPLKFGISFTATFYNQAGALLHVYTDGSVHLNHGGTEMGQGLFMKVAQIVAEELQIDVDRIKISATNTGKVPNTSATAASAGTDLNGAAAQIAARTIRGRLADFAAAHFAVPREAVRFRRNEVEAGANVVPFATLAALAYRARVQLSATGFYKTPKIHWDRDNARGRPFLYFAYGAAVAEVLVDTLTGEYKVTRADLLHDVGHSINPAIDRGQVEGGFIQGMGWLTTEELWFDAKGRLATHAPSTYKIPVASDLPRDFRVRLLEGARNAEDTVHRSKAVGEPPLMLANAVFFALKDAVAAAAGAAPSLAAPATPERVLLAIEDARGGAATP
ncbi:MAG: xanthine dehydrogenase molybdopterin binding subunit [Alphaproteobacteria bacterium]|nr:xanthine dehydrogenase molybdopterin binding subunit [Alphaproteobacteria bacterium]